MSDYAIDVSGLRKSFGDLKVVEGLNLQVAEGEICGFLGANGSGKTTTIRMLCGLLKPDGGSGRCLGYDIIEQPHQIRRQVGYMTQRFSLYEDLTVFENLDFVARVYETANRREAVGAILERMGLKDRRNQLAGQLSGGWKQRLALAACVLHQPKLLLLDEPTAGVDAKARREFWDLIHDMAVEGLTTLVSTHYMDEAERCKRIVYLAQGRIVVQGGAEAVVQNLDQSLDQIMTTNVISLDENDTVAAASKLFARYGFRAIPILGEGAVMKGAIPYRDIMQLSHRFI